MMTRITDMIPAHVPAAAKIEALCFTQPWSEQALLAGVMNPSCIMLAALNEENIVMGWAGARISAHRRRRGAHSRAHRPLRAKAGRNAHA